jgi:hypothetical protein
MKHLIWIALLSIGTVASAEKVGPAGCGLGYQFFHKDNQILAATTNDLSLTNMFGITTGTSGCEEKTGVAKLDSFIESNRVALADDAARGHGETLAGLSQILECADVQTLGLVLKDNYDAVFTEGDVPSRQIGRNVRSVLKSNNVACARAG